MANKNVFDEILLDGIRKGKVPARNKQAREWYRDRARNTRATPLSVMKDLQTERSSAAPRAGTMYLFEYDAKHKRTLPYYDAFPLIFPLERYDDGFLGMNMHYLPYGMRAKLMDALYSIKTDSRFDEKTRIGASYHVLSTAAKYRYFEPCIKRYLNDHVQSRFIKIEASEWDIALFLPLARFKKANIATVHRDSLAKIRTRLRT